MLSLEPPIRDDFDEVLWRQRVEKRNCKCHVSINSNLALVNDKLLVMKDMFRVAILNENPKQFGSSMKVGVPLKLLMCLQL
jgi:hypothetical protein